MQIESLNNVVVPEYLNGEFFQEALEEGLREPVIVVKRVVFEMGTNPGDNYCSTIYRVRVAFQRGADKPREEVSLIVKSISVAVQFIDDMQMFLKEKKMYLDVLPRLEILLDGGAFAAKCLYVTKKPVQTLVFQDLKALGFATVERQRGLDEIHAKLILRKLGQFHASSMVLLQRDPEMAKQFNFGMLSEEGFKSNSATLYFGNLLKNLAYESANWEGFEEISKKLHRYHDNFAENVIECARSRPGEIRVMNHGDLWISNFMYRYENDDFTKPLDAYFVDFQTSYFSSLGGDFNFFLNSSISFDLLKNKREELVEAYYESLQSSLEEMRYKDIPTLDDVRREIRDRERYGLFAMFAFRPVISMDPELSKDSSLETFINEETARKKCAQIFASQKLQEFLKYALKRFDDMGVLD